MRVGQARRRDANEGAIADALNRLGYEVTRVSSPGAPDLIARKRGVLSGVCYGMEVKTAKGKRTKAQDESQWPIVKSVEDALRLLGIVAEEVVK